MVRTTRQLIDGLTAYCRGQLPGEACGALLGRDHAGSVHVEAFAPLANAAPDSAARFAFAPGEWIDLLYRCGQNNSVYEQHLVGIFHSHPAAPAAPSRPDGRTLWRFPTYWIVSLSDPRQPDVRAYQTKSSRSFREQLLLIDINLTVGRDRPM